MVQIKKRPVPQDLSQLSMLHPVLRRIYAARGVTQPQDIDTDLKRLLPFDSLMGIDKAVARIELALRDKQHIMIVGDFDADGATSTTLAVSALRKMGAKHVSFLVPNRFVYGYGLTPPLVDLAATTHPKLLITVDNGISSVEGVLHANSLGMDVVITDHHLPGEQLPDACAIVNPNQVGDAFPSKCMAGVGVIFYVMLALRRRLQDSGWFNESQIECPNMAQFLDLVALGTVADVVPLDSHNRILVAQGIRRVRQGLVRPGIQALIEVALKTMRHLRASDFGFAIAPRLNAAGRLDDMSVGISCLLSETYSEAQVLAAQLDQLNDERRLIEQDMRMQANLALQAITQQFNHTHLPAGLCLQDPSWHQGVIGILAGRLKEMHHRPVFIFAKVSDTELKGSGRSVSEVNIRDVLAQINQDNPGLMGKFGGHAMAAGMSLHPNQFEAFKTCFEVEVAKHLPIEKCQGELLVDGPLEADYLTLEIAKLIQDAGPWGQQFPEPLFEGQFHIIQQRRVGQKHLKLTLKPQGSERLIDAIAFNVNVDLWPNERIRSLYAVYALDVNVYQGIERLQLIVHYFEPASAQVACV